MAMIRSFHTGTVTRHVPTAVIPAFAFLLSLIIGSPAVRATEFPQAAGLPTKIGWAR